mgnify:CR=1 FL=1
MIDDKIGFKFKNRKLINAALTHPSKSKENYQRLEFLGDSILDFLVGEYLFKNSDKNEGDLTVLRSHFVSEEYLSECFDRLQIEDELFLGKSLKNKVTRAIKGDVFEAIVGAIYLEFGLEDVRNFIIKNLQLENFNNVEDTNYKSQLQELVQGNFKCTMKYETEKEGEIFVAKFFMDEDLIATGYGKDKLSAEQNCAFVALNKLFVD